jgi:hypothetical protein
MVSSQVISDDVIGVAFRGDYIKIIEGCTLDRGNVIESFLIDGPVNFITVEA